SWTEDGFVFQFLKPRQYTLTLLNTSVDLRMEEPANFTWHISVLSEIPEGHFTVRLASNNAGMGSVLSGNGIYKNGKEATIAAKAQKGCRFVNWTKQDGTVFCTEAVYTFTVTENLELTANFEKLADNDDDTKTIFVGLHTNNAEWGSVSQIGNGWYEENETATIIAAPKEGYRFVNWTTADGSVFSTNAVHVFIVTEDMELTANFEQEPDNVGNESREENGFRVYARDRVIYLSEYREVQVYNMLGQCLYNGNTSAIPVRQSGVYIVRVGARSYKVIVR
ncbi:MAG: hypothetical protein NC114_09265, partial [Ruminococcus flavefaciens]|nr:hypothetical protein [Ruminococcus flavefaciens]